MLIVNSSFFISIFFFFFIYFPLHSILMEFLEAWITKCELKNEWCELMNEWKSFISEIAYWKIFQIFQSFNKEESFQKMYE